MSKAARTETSHVEDWGRPACSRVRRWPQNQHRRGRCDSREKTEGNEQKSYRKMCCKV